MSDNHVFPVARLSSTFIHPWTDPRDKGLCAFQMPLVMLLVSRSSDSSAFLDQGTIIFGWSERGVGITVRQRKEVFGSVSGTDIR